MAEDDNRTTEAEERPRGIDWWKVMTNAVSALVATTFVGAAAIVWNAAIRQPEAIRTRVDEAKEELKLTQNSIMATQDQFADEIARVRVELGALRGELRDFAQAMPESARPKGSDTAPEAEKTWFPTTGSIGDKRLTAEKQRILDAVQEIESRMRQTFQPLRTPGR
jgi:hypothetical protein